MLKNSKIKIIFLYSSQFFFWFFSFAQCMFYTFCFGQYIWHLWLSLAIFILNSYSCIRLLKSLNRCFSNALQMVFKTKLLNHFMLFVFTLLLLLLLQLDMEILVLLMIWNASFVVFSWWLVLVFSLLQVVFLLTLFKMQILKITKSPKKKRFSIKFSQITKLLLIYIMNL